VLNDNRITGNRSPAIEDLQKTAIAYNNCGLDSTLKIATEVPKKWERFTAVKHFCKV
jgi:hypothetical protein